jgi:hypothetical protein
MGVAHLIVPIQNLSPTNFSPSEISLKLVSFGTTLTRHQCAERHKPNHLYECKEETRSECS